MYAPPKTEDINELRQWCEEFFDYFTKISQGLGGWENIESEPNTPEDIDDVIALFEKGVLRRI